jgi:hypothetical protein
MISEIILFILGAFLVFLVDTWWWRIDYSKIEKGLEFHEHYHVGLELLILGLLASYVTSLVAFFPIGAGFGFIMAEWRQIVEIKGKQVKPGHPFAYGSEHFGKSTIVGIILTGIVLALLLIRSL